MSMPSPFEWQRDMPWLLDLVGDETVAEAMFERDGKTVLVRYHPAVILRGADIPDKSANERDAWINAAIVEIVEDGQRFTGPAQTLYEHLQGISEELGSRCVAWTVEFIAANPERILRAKLQSEEWQADQ